jgi:hypothetical protein
MSSQVVLNVSRYSIFKDNLDIKKVKLCGTEQSEFDAEELETELLASPRV